ncbi:unnamed protein product [Boreogadus saida]
MGLPTTARLSKQPPHPPLPRTVCSQASIRLTSIHASFRHRQRLRDWDTKLGSLEIITGLEDVQLLTFHRNMWWLSEQTLGGAVTTALGVDRAGGH